MAKKNRRNIARGIVLIIAALFIALALASFEPGDWGSFWKVSNLCGPIGAVLAGAIRFVLGPVFSWVFPVFLGYWGVASLRGVALREDRRRMLSTLALAWICSALVSLAGADSGGGWIGSKTAQALELVFGRIGSVLILIGLLVVTAFILFFGSVAAFIERVRGFSLEPLTAALRRRPKIRTLRRPKVVMAHREAEEKPKPVKVDHKETQPVAVSVDKPYRPVPEVRRAKPPSPGKAAAVAGERDMPLPDISILDDYDSETISFNKDELIARSEIIELKLKNYGLAGKVQKVRPGPVVTTFEFVPAAGVKVSQIASRADDISLALAARAIRILAPIPGKGAVGIEVPNPEPAIVFIKEMMEHYPAGKEGLWVALGKTVTGEPFFADLADMPHLLIAGATGSGKSVCINSIICSLLFHHTPATCRFILVDPKRLELITYNDIPHLLHPVITDAKITLKVLQWMTMEMDKRYQVLASAGVKNIRSYNRKIEEEKPVSPETGEPYETLPYYVTIIDELADIMVIMGNEIYPPITRLSQMARAVGIHLVFATQRPSVDVVTGLIKANFPVRIAFQVITKTDSRTILDLNGAEKLLGNGDMLYLPKNRPTPIRIQGSFISEKEAETIVSYWRSFDTEEGELDLSDEASAAADGEMAIDDELFNKARELVIIHQQGSISLLQRRLRVGYARAARMIDMLEQAGVVGPFEGSKARRVLVAREDYDGR